MEDGLPLLQGFRPIVAYWPLIQYLISIECFVRITYYSRPLDIAVSRTESLALKTSNSNKQTNKHTLGSDESHKEKVKRVEGDGWKGFLSTMTFEQILEDGVCPEDICGRRSVLGSCWAVGMGGVWEGVRVIIWVNRSGRESGSRSSRACWQQ